MHINPGCSSSTQGSCCFQYRSRWPYGALICSFLSNARSHLVILRTKVWCKVLKSSASRSHTHPWFSPQWGSLWVSILDLFLLHLPSPGGACLHFIQSWVGWCWALFPPSSSILAYYTNTVNCGQTRVPLLLWSKSCSDWLVGRRELLEAFLSCPLLLLWFRVFCQFGTGYEL